jgi:hypothetical protein
MSGTSGGSLLQTECRATRVESDRNSRRYRVTGERSAIAVMPLRHSVGTLRLSFRRPDDQA